MILVKSTTQKGASMLHSYQSWNYSELDQVYGSYSNAKAQAHRWCREQFVNDRESHDFRIGNANTSSFCAGWKTKYEGKEALRYETYRNSYIIILEG